MKQLCNDLLKENEQLDELVSRIEQDQWARRTSFYTWTVYDELAHLHCFDLAVLRSIQNPRDFVEQEVVLFMNKMQQKTRIADIARNRLGDLPPEELRSNWRRTYRKMVEVFSKLDSKARIPWYGPEMSARSSATARLMEAWAHGQDLFDTFNVKRKPTERLIHIAHLGVSTFAWSFLNRGLVIPSEKPYVELISPRGNLWKWNEPSICDYVQGEAEEFCLVVTQRRNVLDTSLLSSGSGATWMQIAQCFAGPASNPPAPR
ncbi:MAG: TIGR03084 family protein [Desulfobulbaceae bacterium]|jgi:uncharacterized protein (TIGR03084 family)|nr:TIGR03084 family protein [Desulfobulbaceae bacterium]